MSVDAKLAALTGRWKGTNRLNLSWLPDPVKESDSAAAIELKGNGQFLSMDYTWSYEGEPHMGTLLLGCDTKSHAVQVVWTDSWHMSHKFMVCDGKIGGDGTVNVKGHYSVPDHPDWGWRTEIIPNGDKFTLKMFNVTPEGDEEWAVETEYTRA